MAKIGLKHFCFARITNEGAGVRPTYGPGTVMGKAVTANLTVNMASGELYADDGLAESYAEFSSGSLAAETDDMTDSDASLIYGCSVSEGVVEYKAGDEAPLGGFAYYKTEMVAGAKKYRGYFYPKVRAILGNDNGQTKGSSITFQTTQSTFTIFACDSGEWRSTQLFDTESAAKAWIESLLNVTTWHRINVQCNGAGTGEGASPLGVQYVAAGGSFVLSITGTATALYDNGTEKKTSIAAGKYTLANVVADHEIAVIF